MYTKENIPQIDRDKRGNANWHNEYHKLSISNVPYQDRIKMVDLDKVKFLEEYINKTNARKESYRVRPLHEWLTDGDYEWVKRWGITSSIDLFLDIAII